MRVPSTPLLARDLTLMGIIGVVKTQLKTLANSKLVYNTSILKTPPNFSEKVKDI